MGDPTSPHFQKVFVRGHLFDFSQSAINNYLDCLDPEGPQAHPDVRRVILPSQVAKLSDWLERKNLSTSISSTYFAILHKIKIFNWLAGTHKTAITRTFASLLYMISTKQQFYLGRMMVDHILRHAESKAHKLRIGSPFFIFGFQCSQKPSLVATSDVFSGPPSEIRINYKLFQGQHRSEIQVSSAPTRHPSFSTIQF